MGLAKLSILIVYARTNLTLARSITLIKAYLIGSTTLSLVSVSAIFGGGVRWSTQSNFGATGGMGPNQIGMILSFGAISAWFVHQLSRSHIVKMTMLAVIGMHALGCVATFSRGTMAALVLSFGLAQLPKALKSPLTWIPGAILSVLVIGGAFWVISDVSKGKLTKRFQKAGFSNRDTIATGALEIWADNPFLGIGTGNFYGESVARNIVHGEETGTHNELLRAVAEHGLIGAILYVAFAFAATYRVARGRQGFPRTMGLVWVFLWFYSESYNALKVNAQSVVLGLGCEACHKGVGEPPTAPVQAPRNVARNGGRI
jgi:O-antigen ligase